MDSNSTPIISAQQAPHKNLLTVVGRHQQSHYKNIIPEYARSAFARVDAIVQQDNKHIILDSGCGTGESSHKLACQYQDHWVVAIDKSKHRLQRSHAHGLRPDNLLFVQFDLIYFWSLALEAKWPIDKNYLLYPNPWPKAGHLQRRWHGHAIFPTLVALSKYISLRTNWQVYALEFALALQLFLKQQIAVEQLEVTSPLTAFERKYLRSGHSLYCVEADLKA
jgi:tRNA G46 methylase TrmB